MAASLDVLTNALGRKVAILGDMGELGENEKLLHYNVGCHAADNQIDAIFAVGELSKELVKAYMQKIRTVSLSVNTLIPKRLSSRRCRCC